MGKIKVLTLFMLNRFRSVTETIVLGFSSIIGTCAALPCLSAFLTTRKNPQTSLHAKNKEAEAD
ncbi:hypothetical protein [Neisseria iguanae]|uniref:hypothetical protein n=1 Tax=Neisseria iguanae TaxID=90242 RepID=UPI0011B22AD4|nr:hypothetical protein [Neisseria iguanae]